MATRSNASSSRFPFVMAVLILLVLVVGFGQLNSTLNTLEERLEALSTQVAAAREKWN